MPCLQRCAFLADQGAAEPVPNRHIAEILAALADEYAAADQHTRESLRIRFWHAYPDLRESADSDGSSPSSAGGWWPGRDVRA